MRVAAVASGMAAYILKRRYLRGIGLHITSIDLTIRRGYRRKQGARAVLRRPGGLRSI